MESRNDLIQNIELEPSKFDIIKEMLQAHINLLLQHSLYLRRFENQKVSDDDINDYIKDVLGFSIPSSAKFRESYLHILKETLDLKLKTFLKLSDLATHKDNAVAISSLYLGLEYELRYAENELKIVKAPKMDLENKIRAGLHSIDFIKSINKRLVAILPDGHKKLETIILIKTHGKSHVNGGLIPDFRASFSFNWRRVLDDQIQVMKKLEAGFKKLNSGQTVISDPKTSMNAIEELRDKKLINRQGEEMMADKDKGEMIDAFKSFTTLPATIQNRLEKNHIKTDSSLTAVEISIRNLNLLRDNIEYFYSINPNLETISWSLGVFHTSVEKESEFRIHYEDVKNDFLIDWQAISRRVSKIREGVNSICRKQKWKEHWEAFAALLPRFEVIESELKDITAIWPKEMPSPFFESDLLELQKKANDSVAKARLSFQPLQEDYLSLLTLLENKVTEKPIIQRDVPNISQVDTERTLFLREREKDNQEYKRQVEEHRLEKEKRKKVLPEKLQEEVKPNQAYKNLDVEEVLLTMSDSHFNLLKSILNCEKGISYKEICHLIENQFKGEVEEIGAGSSHKRIRIAKYFVEVTSHWDEVDEPMLGSASIATGGFFRPHGGESKMSKFNLELVTGTFKKAGITLDRLEKLEVKRAERKNALGFGSNSG